MPRFERITLLAVAVCALLGLVRAILGPAPPVLLLLSPLVWAVAAGGVVQGVMVFAPLSESEAEGPNWMAFVLVGIVVAMGAGVLAAMVAWGASGFEGEDMVEGAVEGAAIGLIGFKVLLSTRRRTKPRSAFGRSLGLCAGVGVMVCYEAFLCGPRIADWADATEQEALRGQVAREYRGVITSIEGEPSLRMADRCILEVGFYDDRDAFEWTIYCETKLRCGGRPIYEGSAHGCRIDPAAPHSLSVSDDRTRDRDRDPALDFSSATGALVVEDIPRQTGSPPLRLFAQLKAQR